MTNTQKNLPVTVPTDANSAGVQVNRPVAPPATENSPRDVKRNSAPQSPK